MKAEASHQFFHPIGVIGTMAKIYKTCCVCGKDIPLDTRKFKNTCNDVCSDLKQKQIDQRAYAAKMAKDPLYATKQSRRQYARIKSDPESWRDFQKIRDARNQMPNYRESLRKSWRKYKRKNKDKISEHTRQHRAAMGERWTKSRLESERKRGIRRKARRQWLKDNDPKGYELLREQERAYEREHLKRKRLNDMQKNMSDMLEIKQGQDND